MRPGGQFSCSYLVRSGGGERAFFKAMGYTEALLSPDPVKAIEAMTTALK